MGSALALAITACSRDPIASCEDDLRGVYAAGDQRWMVLDSGATLTTVRPNVLIAQAVGVIRGEHVTVGEATGEVVFVFVVAADLVDPEPLQKVLFVWHN